MLHEKFRTIFRFAGIFLLSTLLPACRPDLGLDAEFKSRLDALRSGTVRHWKSGGEIDYLSAQILKERNPDRRNVLFAAYSNTVVNVPIVATNNLTREKYPRPGNVQGPYRYGASGYRKFVHGAFERVRGTNTFDDLVRQTTQYCDWYCRYYTDVGRQLAMKTFNRIKKDGSVDVALVERNCATFRFWGRTWLTRTRYGQFVSILWTLNDIKEMQWDVDKLRKEGKTEVADALERGIHAFTAQVDAEDGFARLSYDKFCALADSEKDYDPKGKRIYLELMKDALGRSPKWAEKLLAEER